MSGTITDPAWLATPLQLIPNMSADGAGASPGALSADGLVQGRVAASGVADARW